MDGLNQKALDTVQDTLAELSDTVIVYEDYREELERECALNPNNPPKRITSTIINALGGGVVPRVGLEYIAVGRDKEIDALLHDVEIISSGGAAFASSWAGTAAAKAFCSRPSATTPRSGALWWWTPTCHRSGGLSAPRARGWPPTRSLMQNMSTKTKPDGGALPLILERWLSRIKMDVADAGGAAEGDPDFDRLVEKRVRQVVGSLEGWSTALNSLRPCCCTIRRTTPETMRGNPGRSLVPGRIRHQDGGNKNELGIHLTVTDDNWYDFLKIFASFLVHAGYRGCWSLWMSW